MAEMFPRVLKTRRGNGLSLSHQINDQLLLLWKITKLIEKIEKKSVDQSRENARICVILPKVLREEENTMSWHDANKCAYTRKSLHSHTFAYVIWTRTHKQ